jgi:hypothetical protein
MISFEYIFGKLGYGLDKFVSFIMALPWYGQIIIGLLLIIAIFIIQNRLRY